MSFSDEPIIPTEPTPPPARDANAAASAARSRRRRANRREMFPADAEGQAALISALSRRAYPSFELFVFSLACGAILGLGFLLDSQAVLLLGILITPLMTPWVGFLLAILTGSPRFLFETLMALLISAVIVFLGGLLTGFAARLFLPITLTNVFIHARLWIPTLVVLAVGAITLVASFARSENKPFLPSVIIAYAFYLPINAGGFGLGSGVPDIWPQGIKVFAVHFALASILGLLTLFALRLRPTLQGIFFSAITLLLFAGILVIFMGTGFPLPNQALSALSVISTPTTQSSPLPSLPPSLTAKTTSSPRPSSTSTQSLTASITPTAGTVTATATAATATGSPSPVPLTLSITLPATETPTVTLTFEPQTISGTVGASEGGGANLRQTPNGKYLMTLDNGTIVEIYPDFKQVNGVDWLHVIVTRNGQRIEGWLLESVVSYATPAPNFEPSATP
ncbi:MAG: DUF389 domain-containing protein [Anaerolineales bacterium]|nr:DUF389 domain-containing protein [Anaerolineales bacterium]